MDERKKGKGCYTGDVAPANLANLYVKGFPLTASEESIKEFFSTFGTVTFVTMLAASEGDTSIQALLRFASEDDAKNVQESMNGVQPEGYPEPFLIEFKSTPAPTKVGLK